MKNMILGFATNQRLERLEIFCKTARDVYGPAECDIALIVDSDDEIGQALEPYDVTLLSTTNTYSAQTTKWMKILERAVIHTLRLACRASPRLDHSEFGRGLRTLLETWPHPHIARWFTYQRLFKVSRNYNKVLLVDTRDVLFQDRFFETAPDDKISIYFDGETMIESGWNGRWYIEAFGRARYREVSDRTPICVGTIIGPIRLLADLVDEYCAFIQSSPFRGIEQAQFNYLYFREMFNTPVEARSNFAHEVATLAGEEVDAAVKCDDEGIRHRETGRRFPIVHMYDRRTQMLEYALRQLKSPPRHVRQAEEAGGS